MFCSHFTGINTEKHHKFQSYEQSNSRQERNYDISLAGAKKEEPPYNDLISIVKEEPHDFDNEEEEHLLEGELMEMQQPDPPSMEYHV